MARCIGCGIKLQSVDENKPGYVPNNISSDLGEKTYCKRCYQIIHNGLKYDPILSANDYYKMISVIKEKQALVVLMIDVLNIYSSFIPNLSDYIGNNEVIIVVNKIDILPKSMHLNNLENRVRELAASKGLNVAGVILISAKNKKNVEAVFSKIAYVQKNVNFKENRYKFNKKNVLKDFYILGCTSVGKSTFVNAAKELYCNDKTPITTSDQMQTTMDFIKVPLDEENFMIDTPGLINYHSYEAYLSYESIKKLMPHSYLKPRTYQLSSEQTIFIGGLVRIDFMNTEKMVASFYISNDLYLHRTKTSNADTVFETQNMKLLVPPLTEEENEKIKEKRTVELAITSGVYDLFVSGLGFIHIVGSNMKLRVTVQKDIDIHLVPTFF